jgi:hypothetical protein
MKRRRIGGGAGVKILITAPALAGSRTLPTEAGRTRGVCRFISRSPVAPLPVDFHEPESWPGKARVEPDRATFQNCPLRRCPGWATGLPVRAVAEWRWGAGLPPGKSITPGCRRWESVQPMQPSHRPGIPPRTEAVADGPEQPSTGSVCIAVITLAATGRIEELINGVGSSASDYSCERIQLFRAAAGFRLPDKLAPRACSP